MDMSRLTPDTQDKFIREEEWKILLENEAFRQLTGSKYPDKMQKLLDSLDEQVSNKARREANLVSRIEKSIDALQRYAQNRVKRAGRWVIQLACECHHIESQIVGPSSSSRQQCLFVGNTLQQLHEVSFVSFDASTRLFSSSEKFVVCNSYLMLLYSCYIMSHAFGWLEECIRARSFSEDTNEAPTAQTLETTTLEKLNDSAKAVYCFFYLQSNKKPLPNSGCICHLKKKASHSSKDAKDDGVICEPCVSSL